MVIPLAVAWLRTVVSLALWHTAAMLPETLVFIWPMEVLLEVLLVIFHTAAMPIMPATVFSVRNLLRIMNLVVTLIQLLRESTS